MQTTVAQSELQCLACAGQCVYSPSTQSLVCTSCASEHPIAVDPDADAAAELHYDPDMPHTEQSRIDNVTTHACQTCGGEVIFTGPTLSERCAYCDGPVILKQQAASYQTLGVIPFQIDQEDAQGRALAWGASRLAAPDNLQAILSKGRVAGIYVPFWTFDSNEVVSYFGSHRVRSGKNTRTKQFSGHMRIAFDDLLMPASHHVTPLIRDGILHDFNPYLLRPYAPAYLAGFAAERHHQSVSEGLAANVDDKDLLIRNQIKQKHRSKRGMKVTSYKTTTTGIRYRRILLPVWILHYTYQGTSKKIVVCGLQGRTFGERPFSTRKLAGYAAAISIATILFGWIWGAAQLL